MFLSTLVVLVVRTIITSVKYGYYSKCTWYRLNESVQPIEKLMLYYLLASWDKIPKDLIDIELIESFNRHTDNISDLKVIFKTPLPDNIKAQIKEQM